MRRREFIALLGGAAAGWPLGARAQQSNRPRLVGVLFAMAPSDPEAELRVKAFEAGLRELGWTEGRNLRLEYRWAPGDATLLRSQATELVGLGAGPDPRHQHAGVGGFAPGEPPADRVRAGDRSGRRRLRAEPRPPRRLSHRVHQFRVHHRQQVAGGAQTCRARRSNVWRSSSTRTRRRSPRCSGNRSRTRLRPLTSSRSKRPSATSVRSSTPSRPSRAMANGGLMVLPDVSTTNHRDLIIALAARHRLPAVYPYRHFAASGGLMSYGSDLADVYRRAASYVDRILKGAVPGDLPVQAPVQVRARHQPQDRQRTGPHRAAVVARPRRRGD